MENKFSMEDLYKNGVTYLSRDEESRIMARVMQRNERTTARSSLDVGDHEYESLAFLKDVRRLVDEWLALGKVGVSVLSSTAFLTVDTRPGRITLISRHLGL